MRKLSCILLIDDDPISNFISKKFLETLEITEQVKVALNGRDALLTINSFINQHNKAPELIFCDIKMPIMDGFEFIKEFQSLNFSNKAEVVTVMVTTSNYPKDKIKASSLGIKEYVNKPLIQSKIMAIMNKYFSTEKASEPDTQ